jgi:hypothetical protein
VYVQIAFAIIFSMLVVHELITATLRSHLLTMYSILIALQLAHRAQNYRYSIQDIVVITITWALVISSFCGLGVSFQSTQMPVVIFDFLAACGGFVWTVGLMVEARNGVHCLEVAYPSTPIIAKLPFICWALAAVALIPMILYVGWVRTAFRRTMFAAWFFAWIATMISAEISMAVYLFKDAHSVELLAGSSWGFGQVMAMVALASQIFGIINFYGRKLIAGEQGFVYQVVKFVSWLNHKLVGIFHRPVRQHDQEAATGPHPMREVEKS